MTYNLSVGAAHGARGTRVAATDPNNGKGGAVQANETSEVTEDDAEQSEQDVARRRGTLSRNVNAGYRVIMELHSL